MVLLHHTELAQAWTELANVLKKASYPASVRELAILLVARHWDADFEWYAHVDNAVSAGVPPSVIEAIRTKRMPVLEDPLLAIVYTYVSSLLGKHKVSEADYRATREALGQQDLITLTALVGHYCNVALTLLAHEVPLPDGVVPALTNAS